MVVFFLGTGIYIIDQNLIFKNLKPNLMTVLLVINEDIVLFGWLVKESLL
jgi:hypothetical protein